MTIIPKPNRTQTTLGGLVISCLGFDLVVPQVLGDFEELLPLFAGVVFGQMILLSLWSALSIEPFVVRIPRAIALFVFGCYASLWSTGGDISVAVSFLSVIVFLMIQVPLWMLRWTFDRTICKSGQNVAVISQFGIKTMLMWTTLVAVILSLGQFIFEGSPVPRISNFPLILMYLGFLALFVAVVGFPLTWVVMLDDVSVGWLGTVLGVFLLVIPAVCGMLKFPIGLVTMFATGIATMTVTGLWVARCLGYRLEYRASPAAATQASKHNEIDQL